MKIQINRSEVLETGVAKAPTSAQLSHGELAINYASTDPTLFYKDNSNTVRNIKLSIQPDLTNSSNQAGTLDDRYVKLVGGTLTGDLTGTNFIGGVTRIGSNPPTATADGELWYNTNDGRIYVRYTDGDGDAQWVDASPDTYSLDNTYYTKTESDARYLGINDTADNSTLLAGQAASYYLDYTNFSNTPNLATVAISGDYTDLSNTPNLATVATSGDYTDLSNTPNLATVATSGDYTDLSNTPNLATVATSGDYTDLSNTPSLATVATTGSYSDLLNIPSFSTVATTGSYSDLLNTPSFATVATTGSYNDLSDTPDPNSVTGNLVVSGNVGINHSTPPLELSLNGDFGLYEGTTEYGRLFNDTAVLHLRAAANMELALGTEAQEQLRIDGTGRVGIGTDSPAHQLSVESTSGTSINIKASTTSTARLRFGDSDDDDIGQIIYNNSNDSMRFDVNGGEALRIDNSGNIGIGTTSPGNYLASAHQLVISDAASTGITIATPTSSSGTIAFADGTGAGDNARGLIRYGHSDNSLQFSTDAGERMRIDSSGRLNVGLVDPGASAGLFNVDIDGATFHLGYGNAFTNYYTAGTSGSHFFRCGTSPKMKIDSSGFVGIGTVNASERLHLNGAASTKINIEASTATGTSGIQFGDPDDVNVGRIQYEHNGDYMFFETNASEAMRIDSSGNVGIGTTSPSGTLHLKGGGIRIQSDDNTDEKFIDFRNAADSSTRGFVAYNYADDALKFRAGGSGEQMRIDSSGNVGIGTSTPNDYSSSGYSTLTINGPTNGGVLDFETAGTHVGQIFSSSNDLVLSAIGSRDIKFDTNSSERMRIDSAGNVGIGTTSPQAIAGYTVLTLNNATQGGAIEFKNNGTSYGRLLQGSSSVLLETKQNIPLIFSTNDTERMRIDGSGTVTVNGGSGLALKVESADFAEQLEIHRNHSTNSPAIKFTNNSGQQGILYADPTGNVLRWRDGTTTNNHQIWHAGNDGSGSGLDADTLDGIQASGFEQTNSTIMMDRGSLTGTGNWNSLIDGNECSFYQAANFGAGTGAPPGVYNYGTILNWSRSGANKVQMYFPHNGTDSGGKCMVRTGWNTDYDAWAEIWTSASDGSGSGLDADLLDGNHATAFFGRAVNAWQTSSDGRGRIYFANLSHSYYKSSGDHRWRTNNSDASDVMTLIGNNLTLAGNVTAYSDINLKKNIEVIPNALDKISLIRGVTYERTDTEEPMRQAGVIAQEVEEVLPEVVHTDEDGIKSVAYGNLVSLLIESVKELKDQNLELKARIESLEGGKN